MSMCYKWRTNWEELGKIFKKLSQLCKSDSEK